MYDLIKNERMLVFDIETYNTKEARDGMSPASLCCKVDLGARMSCAAVYDTHTQQTTLFKESQLGELIAVLKSGAVLAGYNIKGFDIPFLEDLAGVSFVGARIYDVYTTVTQNATANRERGRQTLDALWRLNYDTPGKNGNGAEAPLMYHAGKLEELYDYVKQDVKVESILVDTLRSAGLVMPNGQTRNCLKVEVYDRPKRVSYVKPTLNPIITKDKTDFDRLKNAMMSGKKVKLAYTNMNGESSVRTIGPFEYVAKDVVSAMDDKRAEIRMFSIDRMTILEVL